MENAQEPAKEQQKENSNTQAVKSPIPELINKIRTDATQSMKCLCDDVKQLQHEMVDQMFNWWKGGKHD